MGNITKADKKLMQKKEAEVEILLTGGLAP
jgi:hypothetical protein